jgi:hypothetical protein
MSPPAPPPLHTHTHPPLHPPPHPSPPPPSPREARLLVDDGADDMRQRYAIAHIVAHEVVSGCVPRGGG